MLLYFNLAHIHHLSHAVNRRCWYVTKKWLAFLKCNNGLERPVQKSITNLKTVKYVSILSKEQKTSSQGNQDNFVYVIVID